MNTHRHTFRLPCLLAAVAGLALATATMTEGATAEFRGRLDSRNRLEVELHLTGQAGQPGEFVLDVGEVDSVTGISVADAESGAAILVSTRRHGRYLSLSWNPTPDVASYRIRYTLMGPVVAWRDAERLDWEILCGRQIYPLERVGATLILPPGMPADYAPAPLVRSGAAATHWHVSGSDLVFEAMNMPAHALFRVALRLPRGLVRQPFLPIRFMSSAGGTLLLILLPGLTLLVLLILFWLRGRDPRLAAAAVRTAPKPDLTPEIAGTVADEQTETRDLIAGLVGLAREGILRIEHRHATPSALPEIRIIPVRSLADLPDERRRLIELFAAVPDTDRSGAYTMEDTIPRADVSAVRDLVQRACAARGFFRSSPAAERRLYTVAGFIVLLTGLATLSACHSVLWIAKIGWALILSSALLILFAPLMPQRTVKGAMTKRDLLAFANRLSHLDPQDIEPEARQDTFEKGLPFAIVFRFRKEWINRFAAAGARTPTWWQALPAIETAESSPPLLATREKLIQTLSILSSVLGESPASGSGN